MNNIDFIKTIQQETSDDMDWLFLAQEAISIRYVIKLKEEEYAKIMERLKDLAGHKNKTVLNYTLFCETRKGSIDYSSIPELKQIQLDNYRKPDVKAWRLIKS